MNMLNTESNDISSNRHAQCLFSSIVAVHTVFILNIKEN